MNARPGNQPQFNRAVTRPAQYGQGVRHAHSDSLVNYSVSRKSGGTAFVSIRRAAICLILLTAFAEASVSATVQIYHQPAHESAVGGDPDDLLMLAGFGFHSDDVVVYEAVADTTRPPLPPAQVPTQSTAAAGLAAVVSAANVPNSLTVKLPQSLRAGQSYALWVRTALGKWSDAVMINDARPLWFSPAFAYATDAFASLPRELKIVGRNLQPSPGMSTRIQLVGPEVVTGAVVVDVNSSEATNRYVARLRLPSHLMPGRYRVRLARDGRSWVEVPGQLLEVRADAGAVQRFSVSDPQFGGCQPDDGRDDTACIVRAIAAANSAGGGIVYFGSGTWDLIDSTQQSGLIGGEGIIVPDGVSLQGAGSQLTRLVRQAQWNSRAATAAFTLIGHAVVSGFRFRDSQEYQPQDLAHGLAGPFLVLGEDFTRAAKSQAIAAAASVEEVVITQNTFDKTFMAIGDAGLPIRRLFVTANEFGAYYEALGLTGNRYNMVYPFRVDDSVIDNNVFKPGSLLDTTQNLGSTASELGASHRVDFSGNSAAGDSTEFLYRPDDPPGWRAGFFWSLNNNVEELLISRNKATCTGDKTGDGEAISLDNNANTFAFPTLEDVARAAPFSLTVSAAPLARQNSRDIPLDTYYNDHWIQVVSGPGVGQVRKITGYAIDPKTGMTTFHVVPRWDVLPVPGETRISVGREYWQVYMVDNEIDHRQPLCQKSNRKRLAGGGISIWAQVADSVIDGNRQYDTDGILTQQAYILPEKPCADCGMGGSFEYFLEIRGNLIEGEYNWNVDCSASGIATGIAAAPWNDPAPPTLGYGVSISHNIVSNADAALGGAIAQMASWYAGPSPNRWALTENVLIHHNSIRDIAGPPALSICGHGRARTGISFPAQEIAWGTVLYANSCSNVSQPLDLGGGVGTIRVCPSSSSDSCECSTTSP